MKDHEIIKGEAYESAEANFDRDSTDSEVFLAYIDAQTDLIADILLDIRDLLADRQAKQPKPIEAPPLQITDDE